MLALEEATIVGTYSRVVSLSNGGWACRKVETRRQDVPAGRLRDALATWRDVKIAGTLEEAPLVDIQCSTTFCQKGLKVLP